MLILDSSSVLFRSIIYSSDVRMLCVEVVLSKGEQLAKQKVVIGANSGTLV